MAEHCPRVTSPEQVATWLAEIGRGTVEPTPAGCLISAHGLHDRRVELTNARVQEINQSLQQKRQEDETVLWEPRTYEALIREESRFGPPLLLRGESIRKEDSESGLVYIVGTPTDEYTLFLLNQIGGTGALRRLRMPITTMRINRLTEGTEGNIDAFKFFQHSFPRLITIRVESVRERSFSELGQLSSAFLFQLTYNLDVSLVETRSWDDLLRITKIRSRRSTIQDIEAPRRVYLRDLLYHYQMGVAADSPVLAFLSYYHIAEHFFEQVFNDDLIASVREHLTQPGFSYRRKKDIDGLIREISRRQRIRGESTVFSELEALRLTLTLFAKPEALLRRLQSYDDVLIHHYATTPVAFCGGETFDLRAEDHSKQFELIAKRLYKTRNAVVHSKDGDKGRYVPFEHDRILTKEIPLARFIAEDIIVGSSTIMQ